MLVFFWATPVAFISSLITLENIAKKVPFLDPGKLIELHYIVTVNSRPAEMSL